MAIEAILEKLSTEAITKAASKSAGTPTSASQGPSFKDILTSMDSGADFANMLGIGDSQVSSLTSGMEVLSGEGIPFVPHQDAVSLSGPETSEKVLDMLGEVNKGQMQMDNLVNHILYSGQKFSNQELLVIQAHVFHFAQMTELTVKVAEQGVSSVKSVLNTQVQ